MKTRGSILHKLLLIFALPVAVALGLAAMVFTSHARELAQLRELEANTRFISTLSALVNSLQVERGTSSLLLSGGSAATGLEERRRNTDAALAAFQPALAAARLPGTDKTTLEKLSPGIAVARAAVDRREISPAEVRLAYTKLIRGYLAAGPLVAKGGTNFGVGQALGSLILLEEAKESAGLLRATLSSTLAADAPVDIPELRKLMSLESSLNASLLSPAVALEEDAMARLAVLAQHPGLLEARSALDIVVDRHETGGYAADGGAIFDGLTAFIEELSALIQETAEGLAVRISGEARADSRSFVILAAVIALVFLAAAAAALVVLGSLMRTVRSVGGGLKAIAEGAGDLGRHIEASSRDELGQLAENFNGFVDSLRTLVLEVQAAAESLGGVADSLSAAMEETSASARQIHASADAAKARALDQSAGAEESAATTRSIARSVDSLHALVERQSAGLASSSSSIEEMVANVQSVSRNVDRMGEEYERLVASSAEGRDLLERAVSEAAGIGERSRKLEEANELIANVASKTNLLAMNAAIEAAHAGEFGKGFAVVADEIRALAESAAEQSKSIAQDVRGISGAIAGMESATRAAHESFAGILGQIGVLHSLAAEVKSAMAEQSAGSSQILEALASFKSVSEEIRPAAAEMAEGARAVIGEMDRLLEASRGIEGGMAEIAGGIGDVSQAAGEITSLALRNREGVELVLSRMRRFRT